MDYSHERQELATANHILAHHAVVDGFGHVSVRVDDRADMFLIARSMAPALVTEADIMLLDLAGDPIADDDRKPYLERFIHSEIYRARPDVRAIVHSHSPSVIPFSAVPEQPLRPIYHMAAGIGSLVPVFEIRDTRSDATDMLVRDNELGSALAQTLGTASVVLMRGHGITTTGESLRAAVFNAVYAEMNARLQAKALGLGTVIYLSDGEIRAAWKENRAQIDRAWSLWMKDASKPAQ
jgi:ribulose-5-phosphate 4-epimerase/fuculose-1-phosphate aldolase